MVTLGQRIAELRTERGLSAAKLSAELGLPKNAIEKFESGRQTPSKEQQERLAEFFGVSLLYIRGETNDRIRQSNWMDDIHDEPEPEPTPKKPLKKPAPKKQSDPPEGGMLDALLATPAVKRLLKEIVLETLRSPEGQAAIKRALK